MHRKKQSKKYVNFSTVNETICVKPLGLRSNNNKNNSLNNHKEKSSADDEGCSVQTPVFETDETQENSLKNIDPVFSLPSANNNTLRLSAEKESRQAFVIKEEKRKALVIIAKVKFRDGDSFVSCCSLCSDMTEFMMYLDDFFCGPNSKHLVSCQHTKAAISTCLKSLNVWRSQINLTDIEKWLKENLIIESTKTLFCSDEYPHWYGAIIHNYGIFLFLKKEDTWRCVTCNGRDAHKCKHGQLMNFSSNEYEKPEPQLPIGKTSTPIISTSKITCKFIKLRRLIHRNLLILQNLIGLCYFSQNTISRGFTRLIHFFPYSNI